MRHGIRGLVGLGGLGLLLAGNLSAQRIDSETQRATLTGLRSFAVHARVQIPPSAAVQRIEESVLRGRIEGALRREGISMETRNDVRDGSQASLDLLYMVMETRDTSGRSIGFAASSCLQVSQMVRIPRLTTLKHIAYAVVSTWQSCGLLVGDSASFRPTLLQNADEHIARFIDAWRFANAPPPHPVLPPSSELLKATSARYLLAAFGPDRLVDDITPQDIARYTELRLRWTRLELALLLTEATGRRIGAISRSAMARLSV